MAPKKLEPWLSEFVRHELREVIAWKQTAVEGVKIDPESRFGDDGSNLRSSVADPPPSAKVQLTEVKSSTDVASVVISDGHVKIEATLSGEALTTFEEESAAPISEDVWGDVFQLVRFTVVSTSLGRPYVKLDIEEIEYERPYRGVFGDPTAFEDEAEVVVLREQIKRLRALQLSAEDESSESQSQAEVPVASTLQAQRPIETQFRSPRKPRGPTMAKDGFEVEAGDNLQPPIQALSGNRVVSKESGKMLLGLLQGLAPSPMQSTSNARKFPDTVDQTTLQPMASSPTVMNETSRQPETIEARSDEDAKMRVTSISASPSIAFDKPPHPAQQSTESQPAVSSQTKRVDLLAYGRRKVPPSQRKLLDHPSSWLPSLPGRQFPRPNVPIELLTKWNAEATSKRQNHMISHCSGGPSSRPSQSRSPVPDASSDSGRSNSDVPYDWPPTQSPQRRIPPPSTIGSVIRSTQDDLEVAAPRILAVGKSPSKRRRVGDSQRTLPSNLFPQSRTHSDYPDLDDDAMSSPQSSKSNAPLAPEVTSKAARHTQLTSKSSVVDMPVHSDRVKTVFTQSGRSIHAVQASLKPLQRTREAEHVSTSLRAPSPTSSELVGSVQMTSPYPSADIQLPQPLISGSVSNHEAVRACTAATQAPSRSKDEHTGARAALSSSQTRPIELARSPSQQKQGPDSSPTTGSPRSGQVSTQPPKASRSDVHGQSSPPASQWALLPASPQLQLSASSPTHRNPAEYPRMARREFFENAKRARREGWLKEHYRPDRTGNLTLVNLMAFYGNAFPEERNATFDGFLQAAQAVYPEKIIRPGMRYRAVDRGSAREDAHNTNIANGKSRQAAEDEIQNGFQQTEQSVSRANERAVLMDKLNQIRVNWFKQHYLPHTTKSRICLREILDVYRTHHPSDCSISEDDMLILAQQAWPNAAVGSNTLFLQRSSIASPAEYKSSRPSDEPGDSRHETVSSTQHARSADRNIRSKSQTKLSHLASEQQLAPPSSSNGTAGDEPLTPLAEFCQAFIELKPGNGSAFGKPDSIRAPPRIDVLSWKI